MEEYEQQCKEATEKQLKDLQEFCQSPNCNSWRVVSRIKDPKRYYLNKSFIFLLPQQKMINSIRKVRYDQ